MNHSSYRWLQLPLLTAVLLLLSGCVAPYEDKRLAKPNVPLDFALEFHVRGNLATDDPLRQTSRYVLETDRQFHATAGAHAVDRTYPGVIRVLKPAEYEEVYRRVEQAGLLTAPSQAAQSRPATTAADEVEYSVDVQINGRTRRFVTTPEATPEIEPLLTALVQLRAGVPLK